MRNTVEDLKNDIFLIIEDLLSKGWFIHSYVNLILNDIILKAVQRDLK